MIYHRQKQGIRIAEIWYTNAEIRSALEAEPDIIRCHYMDELPAHAFSVEHLYTLLIDLTQDEDTIFSHFNKTTQNEARRSKTKDNVIPVTKFHCGCTDQSILEDYITFFNRFAHSKDRDCVDFSDYEPFFRASTLCIRSIDDNETNEPLTMHCYILSDGRARLHQSASLFRNSEDKEERNKVSRANRFLHFDDMLYFKNQGIPYYDFGGWYGGDSDREKLAINRFKEAFGGNKHTEYSCIIPVTVKGKLSTFARRILKGR